MKAWLVNLQRKTSLSKSLSSIAGLALMVLALPKIALAGDSYNFKGSTANAFFSRVDASGCVFTDVFVFATATRLHDPPGPGADAPFAQVNIFQYDWCTGTELMSAFGSGSPAAGDFQVSRQLSSATLNTSLQVFDFISGNTLNVTLAVNWTSTGDPVAVKERFHFRAPGHIESFRFNGTFRPAEASGSVSDGVTNLTPNTTSSAEIGTVKYGSVVID
jgi:hypothetical protein